MTSVPDELDRRFRDAAASAGLLDVAYDYTDSPVGRLLVATSERGLCRISFDPEPERELDWLTTAFGARVLRSARPLDPVRRELDEYFEGGRHEFDLTVDLSPLPRFQREVLEDFAEMTGTELIAIDADTTPRGFRRELRWNAAYHRLAASL